MEIILFIILLGPLIGLILNWISPEEIKSLNKHIRFASILFFLAIIVVFLYKNQFWYFMLSSLIFSIILIKLPNKWVYFASFLLLIPLANSEIYYYLIFLYGICAGGFIFTNPKKDWLHFMIFYVLALIYAFLPVLLYNFLLS